MDHWLIEMVVDISIAVDDAAWHSVKPNNHASLVADVGPAITMNVQRLDQRRDRGEVVIEVNVGSYAMA